MERCGLQAERRGKKLYVHDHYECHFSLSMELECRSVTEPGSEQMWGRASQLYYAYLGQPDSCDRGGFRQRDAGVGRHLPPEHGVLPLFLDRFSERYKKGRCHFDTGLRL